MAIVLRPLALRFAYASDLATAVPRRFDHVLRRRLTRGFGLHVNRHNPYVSQLFLGVAANPEVPRRSALTLVCADAASYLEACAPGSFDAFALSNILDGARRSYADRLLRAVRRAATPAATLVLRSFAEPIRRDDDRWAARDRSLLWGTVRVQRARDGECSTA